jgi:hypothetical protein
MKLTTRTLCILFSFLVLSRAFSAELHPALKHTAEQYDRGMKAADASVAAQIQAARDGYLAVLSAARKREEGAKRPAGVAGIDAEIAAVKAGPIEGKTPEQLPADLGTYRDRFIAEMKRAPRSNDSVRKHATESYLNWLSGMEGAVKGKDEALVNAILAEKKRVLDQAQKAKPGAK